VGQRICTVCCGTKRLVEIQCPATCPYLAAAREHPPAVVQREQQRDWAALLPTVQGLSDRQHELFFLVLTSMWRREDDPLRPLRDGDVADAAATFASTLETAARGVIYEHQARSVPAQRLTGELKALVDQLSQPAARHIIERDMAIVLRAIERGARDASRSLPGGDRAYVGLVARVARAATSGRDAEPVDSSSEVRGSGLILPPG
jgi:hypothetical protein